MFKLPKLFHREPQIKFKNLNPSEGKSVKKKRRVHFNSRKIFIFILALFFSALILGVVHYSQIQDFIIQPENLTCATDDQIKAVLLSLDPNYIFLNSNNIRNTLRQKFLCINDVRTTRLLKIPPLSIQITEREPVVNLKVLPNLEEAILYKIQEATSSTDEANLQNALQQERFSASDSGVRKNFLVDTEGVLFKEGVVIGLPTVYWEGGNFNLGSKINSNLVDNLLLIFQRFKILQQPILGLKVVGDAIYINSTPEIILSTNHDMNTELASLQLILEQAKMNPNDLPSGGVVSGVYWNTKSGVFLSTPTDIQIIDLRFDKPVITYSP